MPAITSHTVAGGDGITLRVDETGDPDGHPIVFIHGYTQSRLSWDKQMHSDLADHYHLVALDNRGHGASEKPEDAYDNPALWADDIQAVIDHFALDDPVLVGWSYGGVIISDYLEIHGEDDIAGVNFVAAVSKLETVGAGKDFRELVPGFVSTNTADSVEALRTFVQRCVADQLSPQDLYYALGFNVVVPPYVREGLLSREFGPDAVLRDLSVPVLLTHGEEDTIVLPDVAREHHDVIPNAEASWYAGVGHSPFWEAPDRFNQELRDFVDRVSVPAVSEMRRIGEFCPNMSKYREDNDG